MARTTAGVGEIMSTALWLGANVVAMARTMAGVGEMAAMTGTEAGAGEVAAKARIAVGAAAPGGATTGDWMAARRPHASASSRSATSEPPRRTPVPPDGPNSALAPQRRLSGRQAGAVCCAPVARWRAG